MRKEKKDTRLHVMVEPSLKRKLAKASSEAHIPESAYVRIAILEKMSRG